MSDTVKLVIEMPKEDYYFTKGAETARFFPSEYYVDLILNGIPLDDVLDKIKGYINRVKNTGLGKKKSLEFIEKYIDRLKAESEDK